VLRKAARVPPAAFAVVMATAIVSTAADRYGVHWAALALAAAASSAYAWLLVAHWLRLALLPGMVAADWRRPRHAFGFLTFVAASTVLGERFDELGLGAIGVALVLVGIASWAVLGYGIALSVIVSRAKASAIESVDGGWMLWVVATQSLATAAAMIAVHQPALERPMTVLAGSAWAAGSLLYLVLIAILLARLLLFDVRPGDLDPNYWVTMGATAISVLAAARVYDLPPQLPVVALLRPVLGGFAFMLWAFGTWLVPLLIGLGIWRHGVRRTPLAYTTGLWTIVFPLGMYATASAELAGAAGLPFLRYIGAGATAVALAAWLGVAGAGAASMLRQRGDTWAPRCSSVSSSPASSPTAATSRPSSRSS
jgi:tellurite resistance protein TehA-like permease